MTQVVILAAGLATRLRPHTQDLPKCLLMIHGKTLLWRIIDNFSAKGMTHFVIVVGFQKEKIQHFVQQHFPYLNVLFVENKNYATTNNAYSLLLTQPFIQKDFFLIDSDVRFEPIIIDLLKTSSQYPSLAVKKQEWDEESMKVSFDGHNILKISKEIVIKETFGESIGIGLFDHKSKDLLFSILEKRIIREQKVNEFYEASFQEMIDSGFPFYGIDIQKALAIEVDDENDLQFAQKLFKV